MTPVIRPALGIVGVGKVGSTLARLLAEAGYEIRAIYSPTTDHAHRLVAQVGGVVVSTPEEVVSRADLTLLTVPDDVIESVASGLSIDSLTGKALVHTSGAHDIGSLSAAARRGAMTGSLHPAFPFADVETAMAGLPGATFAVEFSDDCLEQWLHGIVAALGGRLVVIPPGGKAAYHLALSMVGNYTVTLYAAAEQLLLSLGMGRDVADNALNALVAGTVDNIRARGIPAAMVGPLTRADVGTIAAHLDVLRRQNRLLLEVYRGLARLSYPMLEARGIDISKIEEVFQRIDEDETHDT